MKSIRYYYSECIIKCDSLTLNKGYHYCQELLILFPQVDLGRMRTRSPYAGLNNDLLVERKKSFVGDSSFMNSSVLGLYCRYMHGNQGDRLCASPIKILCPWDPLLTPQSTADGRKRRVSSSAHQACRNHPSGLSWLQQYLST